MVFLILVTILQALQNAMGVVYNWSKKRKLNLNSSKKEPNMYNAELDW